MEDQIITPDEEQRYAELQKLALEMARKGETDELEKMIMAGLPVNLSDEKGQSLLMLASYNGHFHTSMMLLNRGADADRRNDRGQTPLGGVAFKGFTDIAALLLDHGADIYANNGAGMTPLHYAEMFGREKVADLLRARGADLNKPATGTRSPTFMTRLTSIIKKVRKIFN